MTNSLFRLAYKSRSTALSVDEETLLAILTVSQQRNVGDRLTGALAYANGQFVQVLEGPEKALAATMDKIQADSRHHSINLLGPVAVATRDFPDWSMARLSVEPGLRHALSPLFDDWQQHGPEASALLARALET